VIFDSFLKVDDFKWVEGLNVETLNP
jgi:hypothetical protein